MCEYGDTVVLKLKIPAHLSHTGKERLKDCEIDRCIAPIVKALNDGGVATIACCCGHKRGFGNIVLEDGREILLCKNYDQARQIDDMFCDIHHKNKIR
jgi:hypothetical protein